MALEALEVARNETRLFAAADHPELGDGRAGAQQEQKSQDHGDEDVPPPLAPVILLLVVAVDAVLDGVGVGQRPSSACCASMRI